MQHEFRYVNLIGGSWRTLKTKLNNTCKPCVPREVRDGKRRWVDQSPSSMGSCGLNHHNSCASRVSFDRPYRFIQSRFVCLNMAIIEGHDNCVGPRLLGTSTH